MKYKHRLPDHLIQKVAYFEEFANGATQVSLKLKDGTLFKQVLISNSEWIIAIRGYSELPFDPSQIDDAFQTDEDKNPKKHGGWDFWDKRDQK
jgi:hypothetical protein